MTIYNVQGRITSRANGMPIWYARVDIFDVNLTIPGSFLVAPVTLVNPRNAYTDKKGYFNVSFDFSQIRDRKPDIIFRVSQNIYGSTRYIYNENPATHTRWNIADVLYANIEVEGDPVTIDEPDITSPLDSSFVFTRIGEISMKYIIDGYANPDKGTNKEKSMDSNQPFGGILSIGGWFGRELYKKNNLKYYRVLCNGKAINDPLANYRLEPVLNPITKLPTGEFEWRTVVMGPKDINNIQSLYELPTDIDKVPWSFPDLLIRLDTTKLNDGLCEIIVEAYDSKASKITSMKSTSLKLMIDNIPPIVRINGVKHISSSNIATEGECKIYPFLDGKIVVDFEASDPKGHLRLYSLNAYYGHNKVVAPLPNLAGDDYSKHVDPTQKWNGSSHTVEYLATPPADDAIGYNKTEMPTCAYQFRLRVDKRTTNGYGLVYWGYEDTYHVTINREKT